jgi:hypothetical protein
MSASDVNVSGDKLKEGKEVLGFAGDDGSSTTKYST